MNPRPRPQRLPGSRWVSASLVLMLLVGIAWVGRPRPSTAAQPGLASRGRSVSGWLPWWTIEASTADAVAYGDALSIVSPFWYDLDEPAHLRGFRGAGDPSVLKALGSTGADVFPTVVSSIGAAKMVASLDDRPTRRQMVGRLATLASIRDYGGLDLDFERMASTATKKRAQRLASLFVTFVQELADRLHADGRGLSVTVMPRTAATTWHPGMSAIVYDQAGLGAAADVLRVMAYNRHWSGSVPGGVAPLPWVQDVIAYTTSQVPPSKVELGVPTYGFDWPEGGRGTAVTYRRAQGLLRLHDATRRWDAIGAEPNFTYRSNRVRHYVWYADARSIRARASLAADHGLRGISLWTLGGEPRSAW
jgi:spore germination protein